MSIFLDLAFFSNANPEAISPVFFVTFFLYFYYQIVKIVMKILLFMVNKQWIQD